MSRAKNTYNQIVARQIVALRIQMGSPDRIGWLFSGSNPIGTA